MILTERPVPSEWFQECVAIAIVGFRSAASDCLSISEWNWKKKSTGKIIWIKINKKYDRFHYSDGLTGATKSESNICKRSGVSFDVSWRDWDFCNTAITGGTGTDLADWCLKCVKKSSHISDGTILNTT